MLRTPGRMLQEISAKEREIRSWISRFEPVLTLLVKDPPSGRPLLEWISVYVPTSLVPEWYDGPYFGPVLAVRFSRSPTGSHEIVSMRVKEAAAVRAFLARC